MRELSFQPFTETTSRKLSPSTQRGKSKATEERNIISVWRNPFLLHLFRKKSEVKGSNVNSFVSLGLALRELNSNPGPRGKTSWLIHHLDSENWNSFEDHAKLYGSTFSIFTKVAPEGEIIWENFSVFIDPGVEDQTFNFTALTAISLGIPTFVSSQSTVGKFLLQLNSQLAARAIVELTGDVVTAKKKWLNKISEELQEKGTSSQWAKSSEAM